MLNYQLYRHFLSNSSSELRKTLTGLKLFYFLILFWFPNANFFSCYCTHRESEQTDSVVHIHVVNQSTPNLSVALISCEGALKEGAVQVIWTVFVFFFLISAAVRSAWGKKHSENASWFMKA